VAVKVLIERTVRPGYERQVLALLREMRAACLQQRGYLGGETLRLATNPSVVLVVSAWNGQGDWRAWERSAPRQDLLERMRPYLQETPQPRLFLEGLSDSHSGA
jgi:antibiotic biosynthesis monooxygenase (ABM) superfamily enzyme